MDVLCRALRTKPDLVRVLFAAGIAAGGGFGTGSMVMPLLTSKYWGDDMARNGSLVSAARAAVEIVFSPAFGRWSDRVPRKYAIMVLGFFGWLPLWPILIGGLTETTLWASCITKIIAGACGNIGVYYALVNDLTNPDERALFFGFGTSIMIIISVVPKVLVGVVHLAFPDYILAPVFCDAFWLFVFMAVVASIRRTDKPDDFSVKSSSEGWADEAAENDNVSEDPARNPSGIGDLPGSRSQSGQTEVRRASTATTQSAVAMIQRMSSAAGRALNFSDIVQLVCRNVPLRNLCIIFVLIALPEVAESDVSGQFVYQCFGILHADDKAGAKAKQQVSFVITACMSISSLCLFAVSGLMTHKLGPALWLKILIPVTAGMMLPVLGLMVAPSFWLLTLVGLATPLTLIINTPLNTLVSLHAPFDRMGEAMSAVLACKGVAPLFGNLLVSPIIAVIGHSRLWWFYIAGAIVTLSSLPFALVLQDGQGVKSEENSSSEAVSDSEVTSSDDE